MTILSKVKSYTQDLRHLALLGFIFLCPVIYKGDNFNLRDLQANWFRYLAICLIATFIDNLWLGAFLVLNVVLFVWHGQSTGMAQVMNVLLGTLIFQFSMSYFKDKDFKNYALPLKIILFCTLVLMSLQMFGIDPFFSGQASNCVATGEAFTDPVGLFAIKECNATFIFLMLPILAAFCGTVGVLSSFALWATFISFHRISAAATVVFAGTLAMLFYWYYTSKKVFYGIVAVALIGMIGFIAYDIKDDPLTAESRFPIWHATVKYAANYPLGFGPDSYRNKNDHKDFYFVSDKFYRPLIIHDIGQGKAEVSYYAVSGDKSEVDNLNKSILEKGFDKDQFSNWDNPHNEYLNLLFQYGFIGIFLLIGLMIECGLRFRASVKTPEVLALTTMLIFYCLVSICHFPLELARTGYLFPIILGAFFAKTKDTYATVN